jgi:2-polyprenyl-3-methyl-5-hydroxy-6-metoxy-1,4-benzoquinol methylase
MSKKELKDVRMHYKEMSQDYVDQYDSELIKTREEYPANYFRLEIIKRCLENFRGDRILDAGVGAGIPLLQIAEQIKAHDIHAFDYTESMVDISKKMIVNSGYKKANIYKGDVQEKSCFDKVTNTGLVDVLLMLGVMPHIEDDNTVLANVRSCMKDGGRAYISFRNDLFSMFTMNRYTRDLIINKLMDKLPAVIRSAADNKLQTQMEMNKPLVRETNSEGGVGYDLILSRMHNPLEMETLFKQAGFKDIKLHWYHYHAAAPYLEGNGISKKDYRDSCMALEGEDHWRGMFLCSAFLVEAIA